MRTSHRSIVAEAVESRRLLSSSLSGGVLNIVGSTGNDVVNVTLSGSSIKVAEGSTSKTYTYSQVNKITADLKAGNDSLTLSESIAKPSSILGSAGNDTLTGGAGKDTLRGGDGNDRVDGRSGDDIVDGQANNDTVSGGAGTDAVLGGSSNDRLDPGTGNDYVEGGSGQDVVDYSTRTVPINATLKSAAVGSSSVVTGKGGQSGETDTYNGVEVILGGTKSDSLSFSPGLSDSTYAVVNQIQLWGNAGNDSLSSGLSPSNDLGDKVTIYGGDGNDVITTTVGPATSVYGQGGNDTLNIGDEDAGDPVVMDLGSGTDTLTEHAEGISNFVRTLPSTIENYIGTFTMFKSITINGNALNNSITVFTKASDAKGVILCGNDGDDLLTGTDGPDTINGGNGIDVVWAQGGNDIVFGGAGDDYIVGSNGNDTLYGDTGSDRLFGGADNDVLRAIDGLPDTLEGGSGSDIAYCDKSDSRVEIEKTFFAI